MIDDDELARRRTEKKQLHSIIEKRTRIKINREFQALKHLIAACWAIGTQRKTFLPSNTNTNKIDGMFKLTILRVSVEYILYLHHIVQKQHEMLSHVPGLDYVFDVSFLKVPLDANAYRNIDQDFSFAALYEGAQPTACSRVPSVKEDEMLTAQDLGAPKSAAHATPLSLPARPAESAPHAQTHAPHGARSQRPCIEKLLN